MLSADPLNSVQAIDTLGGEMQTHKKKRIEIVVEAPIVGRVTDVLTAKGALGFTVAPAISGLGPDGPWSRDGLVGTAGQMLVVICIIGEERKDEMLEALFTILSRHMGFVSVSDCEVVRPQMF